MTIHVRYEGKEKTIETMVNLKNCFDKETNPNAADSMLPVIYKHEGTESVVATMDYIVADDEILFIMNIPPMGDLYNKIFKNIESMTLKITQIEGGNGYLFILND